MEGRLYVDTHILVWLRDGELHKLTARLKELINTCRLYFSEFSRLELQYLYETGKLNEPANEIIMYLTAKIDIIPCDMPLFRIIQPALHLDWTRDPFDRLITANAALFNAPLATRDTNILKHYPYAVC